jgi:hypothetical protein
MIAIGSFGAGSPEGRKPPLATSGAKVVFYERGGQVKTSPALAIKNLFLRLPALNLSVSTAPYIRD